MPTNVRIKASQAPLHALEKTEALAALATGSVRLNGPNLAADQRRRSNLTHYRIPTDSLDV